MRCKSCNKLMTDTEVKRKDPLSDEYAELCSMCWNVSQYVLDGVYVEPPTYAFDDDNTFLAELGLE